MIDTSSLRQIVVGIISSMLGIGWTEQIAANPPDLTRQAFIEISGDCSAIVSVSVNEPAIRQMATAMFQADAERLSTSDFQDALCEVTNMIGGNVKGVISMGESVLSLPRYGSEADSRDILTSLPSR